MVKASKLPKTRYQLLNINHVQRICKCWNGNYGVKRVNITYLHVWTWFFQFSQLLNSFDVLFVFEMNDIALSMRSFLGVSCCLCWCRFSLNLFINQQFLFSDAHDFMGMLKHLQKLSSHDSCGNTVLKQMRSKKQITSFRRLFAAYLNLFQ
jgi:hypothetical protein